MLQVYVMGETIAGHSERFPARVGLLDDLEIVVPRATEIRGRCVDEDGKPLVGVRIRGIFPFTGEITHTNGDGRFAMKVPGTGGGLVFFLQGRVQTGLRDLTGPPEGKDVGDVLLPKGRPLGGRVVDVAGNAVVGAKVVVVEPVTQHPAAEMTTDANGAFRTDLVGPGVHAILLHTTGATERPALRCRHRFDGFTAGTTDALLTVPKDVIARIEVRDGRTDEPREFVTGVITLERDDGQPFLALHHVFEDPERRQSAFDVQFPGPGSYVVEFELPETGETARKTVTVGADAPGTIVLVPR